MVEIMDESAALGDPDFVSVWEGINLTKQLEEAHRQLSIAKSMPTTVQKTYIALINGYEKEMEQWFLDEAEDNFYTEAFKKMEAIGEKVRDCGDVMAALELQKEFVKIFEEVNAESELERSHSKRWDGLERRGRELVRVLTGYVMEGSDKIIQLKEDIRTAEEHYESLRFGIVRGAEEQIAERMTKRYQKMRLNFFKKLCTEIQDRHAEVIKKQMDEYMGGIEARQRNRRRVNELRSELSALRVRYYTEPVDMDRRLDPLRDKVLTYDQTIALLESELKALGEQCKHVEPVSSLKPEVSTGEAPLYEAVLDDDEPQPPESEEEIEAAEENPIIFIDVPPKD